jgi:hypothetical protein
MEVPERTGGSAALLPGHVGLVWANMHWALPSRRKPGNIFCLPEVPLLIAPMLFFWFATSASKDNKIQ